MRFLSVRDLRGNAARIWRELADEKEMIVTSNGRPVAFLAAVEEDGVEEALMAWRQARAVRAVAGIQRESVRNRTDSLSMEQIDAEIAKSRQSSRKRAV